MVPLVVVVLDEDDRVLTRHHPPARIKTKVLKLIGWDGGPSELGHLIAEFKLGDVTGLKILARPNGLVAESVDDLLIDVRPAAKCTVMEALRMKDNNTEPALTLT